MDRKKHVSCRNGNNCLAVPSRTTPAPALVHTVRAPKEHDHLRTNHNLNLRRPRQRAQRQQHVWRTLLHGQRRARSSSAAAARCATQHWDPVGCSRAQHSSTCSYQPGRRRRRSQFPLDTRLSGGNAPAGRAKVSATHVLPVSAPLMVRGRSHCGRWDIWFSSRASAPRSAWITNANHHASQPVTRGK